MQKETIIKMLALNVCIALVNIVLFSNAFLHINILGSSAFETAFGVTIICMSFILLLYGNYKLLFHKEVPKLVQPESIKTLNDCIEAIHQCKEKKTFTDKLDMVLSQIKRFYKKKDTIQDILLQKFAETEISYANFQGAVSKMEQVMYLNTKSILNRISAFDEEEYHEMKESTLSSKITQSRLEICNEYITFVVNAVEDNEEILIKLDKLLLEISKFNSLEDGEVENMDAMKEIDELINNVKWYK